METVPSNPEFLGSDLTAEQRAMMPEIAQVALAILEINAEQELHNTDPKKARELTDEIIERTELDRDVVRESNRGLLQKSYLDRTGFSDPKSTKALQLSLNEEGLHFLGEEIAKVQ